MATRKTKPTPAPALPEPKPVVVVWLPRRAPRDKGAIGLWLGIPGGILAATAALCAAILIAPGVMVAGEDVGWRTPGAASVVVADALAQTEVTLDTPSGDITLTGAELGLSVDAKAVAALAHGAHPLWDVSAWNPGDVPIGVDIDEKVALAALEAADSTTFPAPDDARVSFDKKLAEFVVVESNPGKTIDLDELADAVSDALSSGSRSVTLDANPVAADAAVSTAEALGQANVLNDLLETAGFYVDGKKVAAIAPAVAASWIRVTSQDGEPVVDFDSKAALHDVRAIVATLPKTVNKAAVNEVIVTNSAGDHLRTVQAGADGWKLASTVVTANEFVESFAAGDGTFDLEGKKVPFETTLSFRSIEVNKATGLTILYENGKVVDSFPIAVGKPATPTPEGHFTVFWQLPMQDMGCVPGYDYCTRNVPWVTYFSGDNGFHGTYWHDNFGAGAMMSHGCVNMTIPAAERVYYFAQYGTEVWVHS